MGVGAEGAREVVGTVPELRVVPAGLWQAVKAVELPTHAIHAVPVALRELLHRRVAPHEEGRPCGLGEAGTPAGGGEKGAEVGRDSQFWVKRTLLPLFVILLTCTAQPQSNENTSDCSEHAHSYLILKHRQNASVIVERYMDPAP